MPWAGIVGDDEPPQGREAHHRDVPCRGRPGQIDPYANARDAGLLAISHGFAPRDAWANDREAGLLAVSHAFAIPERTPDPEGTFRMIPPCSTANSNGMTFGQFLSEWAGSKRATGKQGRALRRRSAMWLSVIPAEFPIAQIRPAQISKIFEIYDDGNHAAATLNSERGWLRSFFLAAVEAEYIVKSPATKRAWPRKKGDPVREKRALTLEQEDAFCEILEARYVRLLRFNVCAPLRLNEIRRLLWRYLGEDGVLRVPPSGRKQGEAYAIPLTSKALEALGPRGNPNDPIFGDLPKANSCIWRALNKAAKAIGLPRLSATNLRQTWVARMEASGAPSNMTQRIGGWKTRPVMFNHYFPEVPIETARALIDRANRPADQR